MIIRKLTFYLIGFSLGMIILLILGIRHNPIFAWSPHQRLQKKITYGMKHYKCKDEHINFFCKIFETPCNCKELIIALIKNSEINFNEKSIKGDTISYNFKGKDFRGRISLNGDRVVLENIEFYVD